jgi:wee1-like protein kinase
MHKLFDTDHFQSMVDPDPVRQPSVKEILRHPSFEKLYKAPTKK